MFTMLIIDDEYLTRCGIRQTIEWQEYGVEIIGEACNGEEGLEIALETNPDIILTDVRMPLMDGLEFISKLRVNNINSSVIFISGYEDFNYVRTALNYGAAGYILKPVDIPQLKETVQKAILRLKEQRSINQYYDKLKGELSAIKKQFIFDLISKKITDRDKIKEKICFLEMPIDTNYNFVLYIKINEYDSLVQRLSVDELAGFKEDISRNIVELLLLHNKFMGVFVEKSSSEWVIIIHLNKEDENIIEVIKEKCVVLIKKIREKYTHTISIGISELCNDICEISNAYNKAYAASNRQLLLGSNNITYAGDGEFTGYRREVCDAIKYIKANYHKNITIEIAANELYMSTSYLMHLFKAELNKTFYNCLSDYRIQVAKELLRNPEYKIYDVNEKVGYSDVKYFSYVFKKATGMTPSDYVRKVRMEEGRDE